MAAAIAGGLIAKDAAPVGITVVDPNAMCAGKSRTSWRRYRRAPLPGSPPHPYGSSTVWPSLSGLSGYLDRRSDRQSGVVPATPRCA